MEFGRVRRAMFSAGSSIHTPALKWRTFDRLSISLPNGNIALGA
jgi:hypothetical protein